MLRRSYTTIAAILFMTGVSHAQDLESAYECQIDRSYIEIKFDTGEIVHKSSDVNRSKIFISPKYLVWTAEQNAATASFTFNRKRGEELIYSGSLNGVKGDVTTTLWKIQNVGGFEFVASEPTPGIKTSSSLRGRCQKVD